MTAFGYKSSFKPKPKVLVIFEKDEAFSKAVASFAEKAGFAKVHTYDNAEAFFQEEPPEVDFFIMDWNLGSKGGGIGLFNRIRLHEKHGHTPVIVMSGFVHKGDFRLLAEFPVASLIEKPFVFNTFRDEVAEIWKERLWYDESFALIEKFLSEAHNDAEEMGKSLTRVLKDAPNPVPVLCVMGRHFIRIDNLKLAEVMFRRVLKTDENNVAALTEVAKMLFKAGHSDKALDLLKTLNKVSGENIERLCFTGQVELTMNNTESAEKNFDKVLKMDKTNSAAQAGKVLTNNASQFFANVNNDNDMGKNFASMMNTIGIAKIKDGDLAGAVAQYQASIKFLTLGLSNKEDIAKVMFNLGLGYLKNKSLESALEWFQKAEENGGSKASKYVQRLSAVADGPKKTGGYVGDLNLEEEEIARYNPPTAAIGDDLLKMKLKSDNSDKTDPSDGKKGKKAS
ncbi:MAG: response regulator [Oligoflexales bacterium]